MWNRLHRLILCTVYLLILCPYLCARQVINTASATWIYFRDEFESNYIETIDIDKHGNVWFGTADGMGFFDGVNINRLSKSKGHISGNEINCVLVDKFENRIWFATKRDGLGYYNMDDGESVFFSTELNSIPSNEITSIDQDKNGNIWFSTYLGHICRYDYKQKDISIYSHSNVKGLPSKYLRDIKVASDGNIYAAYYGNGIAIFYPEEKRAEHYTHSRTDPNSLPSNQVGSIYIDNENNLWVGTRYGLALFRKITKDFAVFNKSNSGLPNGLIFSISCTTDGRVYASPDMEGLWTMNLNSDDRTFTKEHIADCNDIGLHAIKTDEHGNMWLGSYGKGLICKSRNRSGFSTISYPESLTERIVRNLTFSKDGRLIIATDGGGLNIIDPESDIKETICPALPDNNVLAVYVDSKENIWVGMFDGGLIIFNSKLQRIADFPIMEIHAFDEYNGKVWMASGVNGLHSISLSDYSTHEHYSGAKYFSDGYLKSLCVDHYGRIWVGSFRSGLTIFDQEMNCLQRYESSNGFISNAINDIEEDSNGNVWIATADGLVKFESDFTTDNPTPYYVYDGLNSEIIMGLSEDVEGSMWVSTTHSIIKINREEKREFSQKISGMSQGNFSYGAIDANSDGIIAFGTSDGIVLCDCKNKRFDLDGATVKYSMLLSHCNDDYSSDMWSKGIRNLNHVSRIKLNHKQNNISVFFATDDISLYKCVDYEYKIKGLDNEWHLTDDNYLTLFQLDPGRYQLAIRPRWKDGLSLSEESILNIFIKQPFFWSLAMKVVYVIIGFISIIYIVIITIKRKVRKVKTAKDQEFNELKEELLSEISRQFKYPLAIMHGPARDLLENNSLDKSARRKARTIMRNIQLLIDCTSQLSTTSDLNEKEENESVSLKRTLSKSEEVFVKNVTEYINQNISSESLDINSLSLAMGLSSSSLYRKMRKTLGVSANDYIRRIRMQKAAELLAGGKHNVSEVAWEVGISSMAYFRQCFKEEFGYTPSQFRNEQQDASLPKDIT